MAVKYTNEMWEHFNEIGKDLPPIPEEFDRKMTRILMQMPAEIPWLFEGYRFDLKKRMDGVKEMEELLPRVDVSEDVKSAFKLMFFFLTKETEEKIQQWNHIEALALNQIELRKDVYKILKMVRKTKSNQKTVSMLQKKIKKAEMDSEEIRKSKPYLKFIRRFLDEQSK